MLGKKLFRLLQRGIMGMPLLGVVMLALAVAQVAAGCNQVTLDFVLLDGDATSAAMVDDITADLAVVGISVNTR